MLTKVVQCPFCKDRIMVYLKDGGKDTIQPTICGKCCSSVWLDDGDVESEKFGGYRLRAAEKNRGLEAEDE